MNTKKMRQTKSKNKVLHAKLAPACFATMMALGMVMPVQAAITPDNSSANQPSVHVDTNGATIVDINKASADGVSHNIYTEFNVDANGVILNNSGTAINTQLAGQIDGNANMAGGSATVILNEVRSSDPSQLNGMVEVAGKSAQVIIANPSGITCDGCGFINTNHATLTTGVATVDAQGKTTGLDVKKGQIVITGKGMDTSSSQYTDIIARSVKVNAQLKANELTITTGSNHVDKNGRVNTIAGTGSAPEMALDVSSLGSMYANKIYMKGTESGVGVRIDHADLTASDSLMIDSQGLIINNGGNIQAQNSVSLQTTKDVINHGGKISSAGMVSVSAQNAVDNSNGKIDGGDVSVYGRSSVNNSQGTINGVRSASVMTDLLDNTSGNLTSGGSVYINRGTNGNNNHPYGSDGIINKEGHITAKGDISIDSASLNNDFGSITTDGSLNINTTILTNSHGDITAGSNNAYTSSMISANDLKNDNGRITVKGQNSDLMLMGNNTLTNRDGSITGEGNMSFNGNLDNSAGVINAGNDIFMYDQNYISDADSSLIAGRNMDMTVTDTFKNGGVMKAGHDISLQISKGSRTQPATNSGSIEAGNHLNLQKNGSNFTNSGKITAAQMDLSVSDLTNSGSITSLGDININGTNLNNTGQGSITAGNDITAWISYLNTDAGSKINAGHDASINLMSGMHNAGDITAAHDVNLLAMNNNRTTSDNYGVISAGNIANVDMGQATFMNLGTIKGEKAVNLSSSAVSNSGEISSEGDVYIQGYNGITNDTTGKIVSAKVTTEGRLNNFGVITETSASNSDSGDNTKPDDIVPDTADITPDNGSVTPDEGDSTADTTVHPNGPDDQGGVWVDGVDYYTGAVVNGKTIKAVVVNSDGSYMIKSGGMMTYGQL
ncbi:two-partner secretion domain-containing protein [Rahnella selenatireducens]|uniref:two-partner secretion domain-containing protein n=1 Tax=Rahnella selenatireducens TaxID=3389797 RepID=UPI0039681BA2